MILAGYIRPFDGKQVLYVLDEKTKDTIDQIVTDISRYSDQVMEFLKIYNISKVELHGSTKFCQNIKNEIQAKELAKYSKNKLIIDLIQE